MKPGYTRITEILKHFSEIQHVDALILEKACVRGTRVHSICEGIIEGIGDYPIEPHLEGYVQSFRSWWGSGKKVIAIEKRFYCDELLISGKVDIILEDEEGRSIVVDLKTSASESKTWLLQGSAYYYLAEKNGLKPEEIHFIKLSKVGKPAKVLKYTPNVELFLKTYEVYKHFFYKSSPLEPNAA